MSKDFLLGQTERDGRFDVQIWKANSRGAGVGRGWWIHPAPDKRTEAFAEILDIISAADAEPNFEAAARMIDHKFRKLCERLGTQLAT